MGFRPRFIIPQTGIARGKRVSPTMPPYLEGYVLLWKAMAHRMGSPSQGRLPATTESLFTRGGAFPAWQEPPLPLDSALAPTCTVSVHSKRMTSVLAGGTGGRPSAW